jgi:hypothetical protein
MLHSGGIEVDRSALATVEVPLATATWFPTSHETVIQSAEAALDAAGFQIAKARFGLARQGKQMFAALELATPLIDGVALAAGIRNSIDKSFTQEFVAGSRVFVCDNLAFSTDLTVYRKHTRFGLDRFREALSVAVAKLAEFKVVESERIKVLQGTDLEDRDAESLILRAYERGLVTHLTLPGVIKEWRQPSYDDFQPRTAWSLYNAFTTILSPKAISAPAKHTAVTMALGRLLSPDGLALAPPADGNFDIDVTEADVANLVNN